MMTRTGEVASRRFDRVGAGPGCHCEPTFTDPIGHASQLPCLPSLYFQQRRFNFDIYVYYGNFHPSLTPYS